MTKANDWGARFRERRIGLLGAAAIVAVGLILIYLANNFLSATAPGQALAAYAGVFVAAGGILYGVSTLLVRE
jgi:drug/metabolite transporter superfamily protein YnfA